MSISFGRFYKITFTANSPDSKVKILFSISSDDVSSDSEALNIYGDIYYDSKTKGTSPNTSTLNIVNFPKKLINKISSNDVVTVDIELGYNFTDYSLNKTKKSQNVFTGIIKEHVTVKNKTEFITSFKLVQNSLQLSGSTTNLSFKKGTTVKDMFTTIAKDFKEVFKDTKSNKKEEVENTPTVLFNTTKNIKKQIDNDRTFEGTTAQIFDELCKEYGLNWNYFKDTILIYDKFGVPIKVENNTTTLSLGNIKGNIERSGDTKGQVKKEGTSKNELTFTTFLDPTINFQTKVVIPNDFEQYHEFSVKGSYKVVSYRYSFNYSSNTNWNTQVVISDIEGVNEDGKV